MLVLSRKLGEQIVIGDTQVTVLDISKQRVRLGFSAPRTTRIVRTELLTKERLTNDTNSRQT